MSYLAATSPLFPMPPPPPEPAKVIFSSDQVSIATYRRHANRPDFEAPDRVVSGHLIVFPRTSVQINYDNGDSIVANPNLVTMYNLHQNFSRKKISDRGDFCEWFAFAPNVLLDAMKRYDPSVEDRMDRPFVARFGPSDPNCYLRQRVVVEHLLQEETPDKIFVEETSMTILEDVLKATYRTSPDARPVRKETLRQHRDIAIAAQEILSTSYDQDLTLNELAAQLYVSPYLLCRIFRQQTGATVHTYLNQLRLRTALETVKESCGKLTDLALNLGYSSHSHFTQAFRNAFGITPSDLQDIYQSQLTEKQNHSTLHDSMSVFSATHYRQLFK
jgi:AraC-like DNA-binding protein